MLPAPSHRKPTLGVVLALTITGALWAGQSGAAEQPDLSHRFTPVDPPTAAPALRLKDLDGSEHDLADLRGRVVIINFWATWCPPCRREMPSMERLYQAFEGRGLTVLAVDVGEDADTVFAFTGQLEPSPSFPMLLDTDSAVAQAWGVKGLPTSFLVDTEGRLVMRAVGGTEFDDPAAIEQLTPFLPTP